MKKLFILTLIIFFNFSQNNAQNILPFTWNFQHVEDFSSVETLKWENSPEINLLLSWERQGLSWIDRNIVLRNTFLTDNPKSALKLEFSLRAEVHGIFINGKRLTGENNSGFWPNNGEKITILLPPSILKEKNTILILASDLAYTGGLSKNSCTIAPENPAFSNSLGLEFPVSNHVYLPKDSKQFILRSENNSESKVHLIIHNDFHKLIADEYFNLKKGKQELKINLEKYKPEPGMYECIVLAEGKDFSGTVGWFAVEPESIKCEINKPADFDAFWQNAISDLHKIEPDFKLKKVDSLCSETREGFIVEMKSLENIVIRGYYFVPKTEGKHPAILHVPGYTYGFEYPGNFINRKGNCAELALCVRGHGISKEFFNPWDTITMWGLGICDKESYVYRSVFMDCVRAVEFLVSRPEIDSSRIGVAGGSQGGALTLSTAALCSSHIAACAFFDPWLCDFRDQAKLRTMVNKELEFFGTYPFNNCDSNQMLKVLEYFDTKNFAPSIKCPAQFMTSLFDDDCPSHCGFSAFNNIKTDKNYKVFPNDSHMGESGQYDNLYYFLEETLNK